MAEMLEARARRAGKASGDQYMDRIARGSLERDDGESQVHPLDNEASRALLRRLLEWFYYERDKQAHNRLEMAIDHDFYDNLQWNPDDAQELRDRGQIPLVYNEVAPMVDWIIGTERRTRVDWHVLPRTEDDVQMADVKRKALKWLSDVNRVPFNRSRSFEDCVKAGVGWIDDGVRDDPTTEPIYNRYEDWRNVLWDSTSYELDLSDARYLFRWRWVDEDVAMAMFPDRANAIRSAVQDAQHAAFSDMEEDTWYTSEELLSGAKTGTLRASGQGMMIDAKRRRVKIYECQYRDPVTARIIENGPFQGMFFNESDRALSYAMAMQEMAGDTPSFIEKVVMRVHMCIFTESHILARTVSPYRHNRFTLTPIWCYRRGRDRLPYGIIRRVRDIQQDLNKRASKALFLLSTNQVLMEDGAVEDVDAMRDEVDRPDGTISYKQGRKFEIKRDTDAATGQIQMMTLDAQSIQKSGGVSQENMGRQTNAVSGEAIKARQLQGSVVTTQPFDNLRLATQVSGEKQLSLAEQFLTAEKVMRLTGAKGKIEWVKVNQPELQPDGSVRFINDITATASDFVVSEADYAGTLRQVMFESLNQMVSRLPPEVALRLLTIAMEFSDLPNKDEIAEAIRRITGERDPNKDLTPEEAQQQEQQMAQQAELMQMQRQTAQAALAEAQGKARKLMAEAMKIEAEAQALGAGGDAEGQAAMQDAMMRVRKEADTIIERLSEDLRKATAELNNRTLQIKSDADVKVQAARIEAASRERVAEIQAASDQAIERVNKTVADLKNLMERKLAEADLARREEKAKETEAAAKKAQDTPAAAPAAAAAPGAAPGPAPVSLVIQATPAPAADAAPSVAPPPPPAPPKRVRIRRSPKGAMQGVEIERTDGSVQNVTIDDSQAGDKPAGTPDNQGGKSE